jgi:catechol 2,3-dioxygenase-like lactoylglutathione lyase family enzyme
MTRALWLPYRVGDVDAAKEFYTVHLGLSEVDSWDRHGERGVVLAAGAAYIELVEPGAPGSVPAAFELAGADEVDAVYTGWRPAGATRPHRYPRGHYGFEACGPTGERLMVWRQR